MYQSLELLSKESHASGSWSAPSSLDYLKDVNFAPLAISEISDIAKGLPVLISNSDDQEFMCVMSLAGKENILSLGQRPVKRLPRYLQSYPFAMVNAQKGPEASSTSEAEEEGGRGTFRAVAIDIASDLVVQNENTANNAFFEEDHSLAKETKQVVARLNRFEQERQASRILIAALKEHDLLDKRSVDVDINGEKKTILADFFIVNRQRLYNLPAETLKDWMKKGWIKAIENHIDSIENVGVLLEPFKNQPQTKVQ